MLGRDRQEYRVFVSSPGDVSEERERVRAYFDNLNRTVGVAWRVHFKVVDAENFSAAGVERPQDLITPQALERFRTTLALVVVVIARRFGDPGDEAESGTEKEARWALTSNAETGFPEVKFFFRDSGEFVSSDDLEQLERAVDHWKSVRHFREEVRSRRSALIETYASVENFSSVLRKNLDNWLHAKDRPWAERRDTIFMESPLQEAPPPDYYNTLIRTYEWLDISGIDSDRAFKLPLDKIYVRLRVITSEDGQPAPTDDSPSLSIQTALERYTRLVIVGDPGSGKSTFLRFIALTLAQCHLAGDPRRAAEQLSLHEPLPIPLFVSCWDLSEHLRRVSRGTLSVLLDFVVERIEESNWPVGLKDLRRVLEDGNCIVLVDGLDEVPTEDGRHLVARLIDELVDRFPRNRYVVTSRVRAYTGETTLGEQFARCDIQPFGQEERLSFLENWIGQLFNLRTSGGSGGREAVNELAALSEAIESSSIRSLAVNPLLLTVIAIVHWNRKRLPEQRVDLYDECIDVLLGQRKDAELQRTSRDTRVLDEEYGEERLDQRAWVRKRFAEIAYHILSRSDDEEIDRAAVVKLLQPHFPDRDSSAKTSDGSRLLAERFLDRQELRSGLFVRRRTSSYRFVHLTFQEYLAAWFLASRDLESTLTDIGPHLRDPKWFEALQLLGGALANRSDEYLDRYIDWLLAHAGDGIGEQAPVIALAANVVRDTQSIANMSAETQNHYEELLRETFDAFAPDSRVPKQTQIELLVALGDLGASVKDQLMAATASRLLDVRRRALEMLVPHLSDDDLFSMQHILSDRSKEPVKTYLNALVARDRSRAGRLVLQLSLHGDKTLDALNEAATPRLPPDGIKSWPRLMVALVSRYKSYYHTDKYHQGRAISTLHTWEDEREETWRLIARLASTGLVEALQVLIEGRGEREETWALVRRLPDEAIRSVFRTGGWSSSQASRRFVAALVSGQVRREDAWDFVARLAAQGSAVALRLMAERRGDRESTWEVVTRHAAEGSTDALQLLAKWRGDRESTWEVVTRQATGGSAVALWLLVEWRGHWESTWEVVARHAAEGSTDALRALVKWRAEREETLELIGRLSVDAVRNLIPGDSEFVNFSASEEIVSVLADRVGEREEIWELITRLAARGSLGALNAVIRRAVGPLEDDRSWFHGPSSEWSSRLRMLVKRVERQGQGWELVAGLAAAGSAEALCVLVEQRGRREGTWQVVRRLASGDQFTAYGRAHISNLVRLLTTTWGEREESWELVTRLAVEGYGEALRMLVERRGEREDSWRAIRRMDDEAVERLAQEPKSYTDQLVQRLASTWGEREESWEFMTRLAVKGYGKALRMLVERRGERADPWRAIRRMDDEAVERLAKGDRFTTYGQAPIHTLVQLVANTWGEREEGRELVTRLAAKGSATALRLLIQRRAEHQETLDLIAGWPAESAADALQMLIDQRGEHEQTWEFLTRLATEGSADALRLLVGERGDHEEIWQLVGRLAEEGPGEAGRLAAWLEWARATADPATAKSIFHADWR